MVINEAKNILIDGIALLETRSIERAVSEKVIFLHTNYVKSFFLELFKEISDFNRIERPKSVVSDDYYSLTELKSIIKDEGYNNVVIDLLFKSVDFNQINLVFTFILRAENLTKEQVNQIVTHALENLPFKRSFEAQRLMMDFITKNKNKIEWSLFNRIMAEFPHSNLGGRLI